MLRRVFVWCLPLILLVLCAPTIARADVIRVCVKPPDVASDVNEWAYTPGAQAVWTSNRAQFTAKSQGHTIYVYDPYAPPESARRLPARYKLTCPAPLPRLMPAPAKSAPKAPAEENKAGSSAPAEASEHATKPPPPPLKDEQGDVVPPGVKRMPERPPEQPRPAPPPPQGVLSNEPQLPPSSGVLSGEPTLPAREDVPRTFVDEEHTLEDRGGLLPTLVDRPGRPVASAVPCKQTKEGCKGEGQGNGPPKTRFERFSQNLMLASGLLNGDLGEDIHRKDGKDFGMIGGDNPEGINNPIVQAAAGAVVAATAIVGLPGKAFAERLERAIQKEEGPIVIHSAEELSKETAEKLAAYYREHIADALQKNGTIGPYEVMKQFTDNLGGEWQAHHILEKAMARDLRITKNLDKIPSVILTKAEHERITKALNTVREQLMKEELPDELWKVYQKVYKNHPHWLDAIRPYFGK